MVEIQDLLYQLKTSKVSSILFEKDLGLVDTVSDFIILLKHLPSNQIAVQERLKIDQAALYDISRF